MPPDAVEVLAAMFEAREEYLEVFLAAIEERYGSFDGWVGLSQSGKFHSN